jgi:DNA-binding response OmpR family regulator
MNAVSYFSTTLERPRPAREIDRTILFLGSEGDARHALGANDLPLPAQLPRAVVIEASEAGDGGRRAIERLREVGLLGRVPTLIAAPIDVIRTLGDAPVDDFVVSPYQPEELYERIRRVERRRGARVTDEIIRHGSLTIDLAAHDVSVGGVRIALTRREYGLLAFLCQRPGRVFTRDELLASVWGVHRPQMRRTVDIHVRRLRAKLGHGDFPLETVTGTGYGFRIRTRLAQAAAGSA